MLSECLVPTDGGDSKILVKWSFKLVLNPQLSSLKIRILLVWALSSEHTRAGLVYLNVCIGKLFAIDSI